MAKSVRTGGGENRGRRASDRRRKTEEQAAPAESTQAAAAESLQATAEGVRSSLQALSRNTNGPTREEIARRAYELYLERGGTHGYDIEDWLNAERELRGR